MGIARKFVQELIPGTLLLTGWEDKGRLRGVAREVGEDPIESGILEPSKTPVTEPYQLCRVAGAHM